MTEHPPAPKYGTVFPEYCPSDFTDEDPVCWRCGAETAKSAHHCLAQHGGPEPRPLVEVVLVRRDLR